MRPPNRLRLGLRIPALTGLTGISRWNDARKSGEQPRSQGLSSRGGGGGGGGGCSLQWTDQHPMGGG